MTAYFMQGRCKYFDYDRYRSFNISVIIIYLSLAAEKSTMMQGRVTTVDNFKRIKIFDISENISDADVRGELLEKCKHFSNVGVSVNLDKNRKRAAYLNFARHKEAANCLKENLQLTLGGSSVTCVPVLSKNHNMLTNASFRGRGNGAWFSGRGSSASARGQGSRGRIAMGVSNFPAFMNARRPLSLSSPKIFRPPDRNLYIGDLDASTTKEELKSIFQRYGFIEDIEIKPAFTGRPTIAFIRYFNLDMAVRAKREMAGKRIGGGPVRLGFGSSPPSNCLWVGGIGPWTDEAQLRREFKQFGSIREFSWPHGKSYAYVLFQGEIAATSALEALQVNLAHLFISL